jgi:hypothetical protein
MIDRGYIGLTKWKVRIWTNTRRVFRSVLVFLTVIMLTESITLHGLEFQEHSIFSSNSARKIIQNTTPATISQSQHLTYSSNPPTSGSDTRFPITKDSKIDLEISGERQADLLYYLYFRPNPATPGIVELNSNPTNPVTTRIENDTGTGQTVDEQWRDKSIATKPSITRKYIPIQDQKEKLAALDFLNSEDILVGGNEELLFTQDTQGQSINNLPRFGYDGKLEIQNISLGQTQKDEAECVKITNQTYQDRRRQEPIGQRLTGICQDGFYKIVTISSDTAGNLTYPKLQVVERDTVAPGRAEMSMSKTGQVDAEYLKLSLTGEAYAQAVVRVKTSKGEEFNLERNLDGQGKFETANLLQRAMTCGRIKYQVTVTLLDCQSPQILDTLFHSVLI